jgi:hypothetical protein
MKEQYTDNGELKDRPKDQEDELEDVKKKVDAAWQFDRDNREAGAVDLRFLAGDQWPESVRQEREAADRPCLTLDHLTQMKNQVVNDIRQAKVQLKAVPDDRKTPRERADLVTSLMRDIQYKSHAPHVYAMAADGAVGCGIGHMRVVQEYANEKSFNQELRLKLIPYPFAVLWDPAGVEPDRSDAKFCAIVEFMPNATFKAKWPKAKAVDVGIPTDNFAGLAWSSNDGVLVGEFYRKAYKKRTIAMTESGDVLDITGVPSAQLDLLGPLGDKRDTEFCVIEHCVFTGAELLEPFTEVAGKYIPVIPVIGTEIHLEKKRVRFGMIRLARDAQQLYNYWRSAAAELIALAPKAKWLVTAKQIQNREAEWAAAHSSPRPYLTYTPDSSASTPEPKRIAAPEAPDAIWQEAALVVDDMKSATGIHDASLGAKSNETSGVAIRNRQQEGDVGTFHFSDNLMRSLQHLGTILLDLIPLVYDTARDVSLMDEHEEQSFDQINMPVQGMDGSHAMMNDLTEGKFAIRASIGPSFTTQRMEAAEGMLEYVKSDPEAMAMIRDLFIRNMDWPGAEEMADRLKRSIPPQLLSPEEQEESPPDPAAQAQNALAQEEVTAKIEETKAKGRKTTAEAVGQEMENELLQHQVGDYGIPPPDHAQAQVQAQQDAQAREQELGAQQQAQQQQLSAEQQKQLLDQQHQRETAGFGAQQQERQTAMQQQFEREQAFRSAQQAERQMTLTQQHEREQAARAPKPKK